MLNLASLSDTLNDPHRFHAAVVHLPVAVSVLGLILFVYLAATRGKACHTRWSIVILYAVGLVCSFLATRTGENAMGDATHKAAADKVMAEHEEMGEKVWYFMAGTAVAVALTQIPKPPVRIGMLVLAGLLSAGTLYWVATAAHLGGELVYGFGVGVPATENNGGADALRRDIRKRVEESLKPRATTQPATQASE